MQQTKNKTAFRTRAAKKAKDEDDNNVKSDTRSSYKRAAYSFVAGVSIYINTNSSNNSDDAFRSQYSLSGWPNRIAALQKSVLAQLKATSAWNPMPGAVPYQCLM